MESGCQINCGRKKVLVFLFSDECNDVQCSHSLLLKLHFLSIYHFVDTFVCFYKTVYIRDFDLIFWGKNQNVFSGHF